MRAIMSIIRTQINEFIIYAQTKDQVKSIGFTISAHKTNNN